MTTDFKRNSAHKKLADQRRAFRFGLVLAAATMMADLISKWYMASIVMAPPRVIPVAPLFNLVLVYNPGISFGLLGELGQWGPVLLSALAVGIIIFLAIWMWRSTSVLDALPLGLIIGGACGNVIDRLHDGAVTDFLDFYAGTYHWPAFNMADVFISIGAALFVLRSFQTAKSGGSR